MIEGGDNFAREPEARTNAITVWYAEGHHVDLAVHRRYFDENDIEIVEHGGVEWASRNPVDITNWFNDTVDCLSPYKDLNTTVKPAQMRRIVQLLKKFVKSRFSWNLPGGLLISVLVSECYRSHNQRDDVALYNTMVAIENRLGYSLEISNPVDTEYSLTYKDEYLNQVSRFKGKLEDGIKWLAPLYDINCNRIEGLKAWNKLFQHSYWQCLIDVEKENSARYIGQSLKNATSNDSLYVDSTGILSVTRPPVGNSIKIPNHRFYGKRQR